MNYYYNLHDKNRQKNVENRMSAAKASTATLTNRYMNITGGDYASNIYESNMTEEHRSLLSRWRLSCLDLAIETGRYTDTPAELRLCSLCNVVEDENHVLFICSRYTGIRQRFKDLFVKCKNVKEILNPKTFELAKMAGLCIQLIEKLRKN